MKKLILFIVFAIICLGTSNAQVIEGTSNVGNGGGGIDGDINIGVKAGFGASTFFGSGFTDISARPGFYIGGLAEIPAFFEGFYFQPELTFALQGADIGFENLNLIYLNIPLMAKYHITDQIAVEVGPQIGILVADNGEDTLTNFNRVNIGFNIGGGYRLNENLYFQLRFSPSFTNILDNTNLKNGVFHVGAAYFF